MAFTPIEGIGSKPIKQGAFLGSKPEDIKDKEKNFNVAYNNNINFKQTTGYVSAPTLGNGQPNSIMT